MSGFLRNVAQLASGTLGAQLILVAATPLLTRLYEADSFGGLALFTSIYSILAGLCTLKYEQSIILPGSDKTATDLTTLTLKLSFLSSSALLLGAGIAIAFGAIPLYWALLPISTLLIALHCSSQQWCARGRNYSVYAKSLVLGAVVNVATTVALGGIYGNSPLCMVLGFASGLIASVLAVSPRSFWRMTFRKATQGEVAMLLTLAKTYRVFPLHVLPISLASGIASYGAPIVLGTAYPMATVGYFAIAAKFVLLPSAIVGSAISEAFRAEFASRKRTDDALSALCVQTLIRIFAIAVPAFGVLIFLSPWAFGLFFGPEFHYSGLLVKYIVLAAFGLLIAQPFQAVFVVLGQTGTGFLLQILQSVGPLLVLLLLADLVPVEEALFWYSVVFLIASAITVAVACRAALRVDRMAARYA